MVASVTWPSGSDSRVVIGGMTMRLRSSTPPMRPGVRRGFMTFDLARFVGWAKAPRPLLGRNASDPPCPRRSARGHGGADLVPDGWYLGRLCPPYEVWQVASHPLHLAAVHVDRRAVQPAAARRDHEGDEAADVLGRAEAHHADVLAVPFAHRCLVLSGALHVGLDAAPEALGLDIARMDGVDLHAVGLAAVGERFGEGGGRRVHRAADGERRDRHAAAGAADGDE